jgi:DNA-binding Lrp family transcriptional regulator
LFNEFPQTLGIKVMLEEDRREATLRAELEQAHRDEMLLAGRYPQTDVRYVDWRGLKMIVPKSCTANRVLTVLIQSGTQTYAQLADGLDISERNIKGAVTELVELGLAKRIDSGNRRTVLIQHIMPMYQETSDARSMCVQADEADDIEAKIKAVQASMRSIFPPDKFPSATYAQREARELLNLTGNSATLVYDGVEPARNHLNEIKSPFYYAKKMLQRESATLAHDKAKQARTQVHSEVEDPYGLTDEVRALQEMGRRQFAGR